MIFNQLKPLQYPEENPELSRIHQQFEKLLSELSKKDLPGNIISLINKEIDSLNVIPQAGKTLKKEIRRSQNRIIQSVEKELKLVPRNYYRNLWMAIGIGSIGLLLGAVFGIILGNMAFIGIGLPIGLSIGLANGSNLDKKAEQEGRQLDLEIK